MSGVIDSNGVQWEHCNGCLGEGTPDFSERGRWVRIDDLCYEKPSEKYECGRDLCIDCANASDKEVELEPETITITVPKDYMGLCGRCLSNEAKVKQWVEFDTPIPAMPKFDIPEATGVWSHFCPDCAKENTCR